jgi:hypothetical protein
MNYEVNGINQILSRTLSKFCISKLYTSADNALKPKLHLIDCSKVRRYPLPITRNVEIKSHP